MKKAAKGVPWFLTSLAVALLVVGAVLAPPSQGRAFAKTVGTSAPSCAGFDCGQGNGNCNSKDPQVNGCGGGSCVANGNEDCSACGCKCLLMLPSTKVCRCTMGNTGCN